MTAGLAAALEELAAPDDAAFSDDAAAFFLAPDDAAAFFLDTCFSLAAGFLTDFFEPGDALDAPLALGEGLAAFFGPPSFSFLETANLDAAFSLSADLGDMLSSASGMLPRGKRRTGVGRRRLLKVCT